MEIVQENELISLTKHLFNRGPSAFLGILGRRGSGKTDLSLVIADIVEHEDIVKHVSTNIRIESSPFPIEFIDNLFDLKAWAESVRGRKLFLFDEIGRGARRRSPMSSLNVKLIEEFQIIRKHKLSIVATTISDENVDKAVFDARNTLDGMFFKYQWNNPKVVRYVDFLEHFNIRLFDIPRTSIGFDTWSSAIFKEHSAKEGPKFKEKHLQILWEISHGKTIASLGLNRKTARDIMHKYIRDTLEKASYTLQSSTEESSKTPDSVTITT